MNDMKPLQGSFDRYPLEQDVKDVAMALFEQFLKQRANLIDLYGMPHLGELSLVERGIAADGLSVMRLGDEAGIRHLFRAWRFKNPQRGFPFLKTYLQVLFGSVWEVNQLWQDKDKDYPQGLATRDEVISHGRDFSDYFLTSRVRVYVDTPIIPEKILRALRSAVAARFVMDVSVVKFMHTYLGMGLMLSSVTVTRTTGHARPNNQDRPMVSGISGASVIGGATVVYTARKR